MDQCEHAILEDSKVTDKYHDLILEYVTKNGETGVNELSKALEVPLSTMQKYLEKQSYFKKTQNRKWDLPENVAADIKANTLALMVTNVENSLLLLQAQMDEVRHNLTTAMAPIGTLKRGVENIVAPVANSPKAIDQRLYKFEEELSIMPRAMKTHKDRLPEEYRELLLNADWIDIGIEKGFRYMHDMLGPAIAEMIADNDVGLSTEFVEVIEKYQK